MINLWGKCIDLKNKSVIISVLLAFFYIHLVGLAIFLRLEVYIACKEYLSTSYETGQTKRWGI